MNGAEILYFSQNSIKLIFYLSLPIIGIATGVGLLVALLQTVIQLQEQTLGFAVKLTAIVVVLAISGPWMAAELIQFQEQIYTKIGASR